ncbi:MAG: hypothetical protein J6Z23_02545 [Lachnospiraceae bacterium]|nr:hypothetical protein [Lachnospiraceae bacterium]
MRVLKKSIGLVLLTVLLIFCVSTNDAFGMSGQVIVNSSVPACFLGQTFTVSFSIIPEKAAFLQAQLVVPDGGLVINGVTFDNAQGAQYNEGTLYSDNSRESYVGTITVTAVTPGAHQIILQNVMLVDVINPADQVTLAGAAASIYVYSEEERWQMESEAASRAESASEASRIEASIEESRRQEQEYLAWLQASREEESRQAAAVQASIEESRRLEQEYLDWLAASRQADIDASIAASRQAEQDYLAWLAASRQADIDASIAASRQAEQDYQAWLAASRQADIDASIAASRQAQAEQDYQDWLAASRQADIDASVAEQDRIRESIQASIADSQAEVDRTRATEIGGAYFVPYDMNPEEADARFLFAVSDETVAQPVSYSRSSLVVNSQQVWAFRTAGMAEGTYLVYGRFTAEQAPDFYYYTPADERFYPYRNLHSGVIETGTPASPSGNGTEATTAPETVVREGQSTQDAPVQDRPKTEELSGQKLLIAMLFSFLFGGAACAIIALMVSGRRRVTKRVKKADEYTIDKELFSELPEEARDSGYSSFDEDMEDLIAGTVPAPAPAAAPQKSTRDVWEDAVNDEEDDEEMNRRFEESLEGLF